MEEKGKWFITFIRNFQAIFMSDDTGNPNKQGRVLSDALTQQPQTSTQILDVDEVPDNMVPRRSERKSKPNNPAVLGTGVAGKPPMKKKKTSTSKKKVPKTGVAGCNTKNTSAAVPFGDLNEEGDENDG